MYDLIITASFFKSGEFFMDIVFPAIAGGVVLLLILNSVLKKFGYILF